MPLLIKTTWKMCLSWRCVHSKEHSWNEQREHWTVNVCWEKNSTLTYRHHMFVKVHVCIHTMLLLALNVSRDVQSPAFFHLRMTHLHISKFSLHDFPFRLSFVRSIFQSHDWISILPYTLLFKSLQAYATIMKANKIWWQIRSMPTKYVEKETMT